jgi:hypothetical protein
MLAEPYPLDVVGTLLPDSVVLSVVTLGPICPSTDTAVTIPMPRI